MILFIRTVNSFYVVGTNFRELRKQYIFIDIGFRGFDNFNSLIPCWTSTKKSTTNWCPTNNNKSSLLCMYGMYVMLTHCRLWNYVRLSYKWELNLAIISVLIHFFPLKVKNVILVVFLFLWSIWAFGFIILRLNSVLNFTWS